MIKRVLPAALAAIVLSAGGAFAEQPHSVSPNGPSGIGEHELGPLAEADMAAVKGKGLRSGACTLAVKGAGIFVFGVATAMRDPLGQGIGIGIFDAAGAICA
ncbi:MAG: hypothetical protein F4210_09045 [Holophagales bacterium]|nr:hypothetical protein [Holophagales bacterium]MYF95639.1 hypothetical protein [Holophagales bacterium]